MSLGELNIEFTVLIKSAHHQPAEPDVGLMHSITTADEIEIVDCDGFRLEDEKLEEYIFEKHGTALNEIAAEAHNEEMRDAADAKADYEYEVLRGRR